MILMKFKISCYRNQNGEMLLSATSSGRIMVVGKLSSIFFILKNIFKLKINFKNKISLLATNA